jgi:lactate 2-monooxygenase
VTWADLAWLREQTSLPIVLKGIVHAEDALRALDAGVDALLVSNHGGRQVDGAIGALDALPAIRDAVGEQLPLWGLALGGQAGVEHVLRCLLAELDLTLALSGYTEIAQLGEGALVSA